MNWWIDEAVPEDPPESDEVEFKLPKFGRNHSIRPFSQSVYYLTGFLNGRLLTGVGPSPDAALKNLADQMRAATEGFTKGFYGITGPIVSFTDEVNLTSGVPEPVARARRARSNTGPRPDRAFGHNGRKKF